MQQLTSRAESLMPPPPPALDPRPNREQTTLLSGLLILGLLLGVIGLFEFPYHALLLRCGFFFAIYALLVATSWLPPSVLSARVDRTLEKWVRNSSTGYYGVVGLSVFAQLELASLLGAISEFEFSSSQFSGMLMHLLMGFSIDSIMNLAWGMGWPGKLIPELGPWPTGAFVGLTWLVFRFGRSVLPHATFELPKKKKSKS